MAPDLPSPTGAHPLNDLLLLPLGATEQHGPHLPLATDTIIAAAWATETAQRLTSHHQISATVAPTLPYGASGEHQAYRGTLSMGHDALRVTLIELVRSAAHHHDGVVMVCGHGGNWETVADVVQAMRAENHRVLAVSPRWDPDRFGPIDAHAGHTETSLMMHLKPHLVDHGRQEPGNTRPLRELMPQLRDGGVQAVSPNGVLGDPTTATAAHGAHLFSHLVSEAVAQIYRFARPADIAHLPPPNGL